MTTSRSCASPTSSSPTCTGEHGVGSGKKAYLLREKGAAAIDAMRSIKAALDPYAAERQRVRAKLRTEGQSGTYP